MNKFILLTVELRILCPPEHRFNEMTDIIVDGAKHLLCEAFKDRNVVESITVREIEE